MKTKPNPLLFVAGAALSLVMLGGCAPKNKWAPAPPVTSDQLTRLHTVPHHGQLGQNWCWAASVSMVSTGLGLSQSQCDVVARHFGRPVCAGERPTAGADRPRWPDMENCRLTWKEAKFVKALSWEELTQEINAGRPLGYVLQYPETRHMVVIAGYSTAGNRQQLYVLDPMDAPPQVEEGEGAARLVSFDEYRSQTHVRTYHQMATAEVRP